MPATGDFATCNKISATYFPVKIHWQQRWGLLVQTESKKKQKPFLVVNREGCKYSRKCTRKGTWFHAERRESLGSRNALNITRWKWATLVVRSQYSCSCSPISQSPRTQTQNFSPPPQHLHYLHTLFSILNEVLALSMFSLYKYYKKWAKAILNRKTNNV